MDEVSLSTLAKRIKAARKAKKKTQDDVAKAIGVSKNTISDWERGLKQPGILNILNYCSVLGISLDELLKFEKQRYFLLIITEEERNNIFSMLVECQLEARNNSEDTSLQEKLHAFEQYLNTVLSKVQNT